MWVPVTTDATSSHVQCHQLCKIDGKAQEESLQLTSDALTNQLAQHPNTAPLSLVSKSWGGKWPLEITECPLLSPPHGHALALEGLSAFILLNNFEVETKLHVSLFPPAPLSPPGFN